MLSIGFILLTHGNESQALRLVSRLNQVFDDPPIACHHDFSKEAFQIDKFPGNVHFVQPHVRTQWGTISLVTAMLKALRLLYDKSTPDWFYLLSGADYPIRDAESIRSELAGTPFDAYLRLRRIDHARVPDRAAEDGGGLESQAYLRLAYQRYIGRSFPIPSWRHPHRGPAARHIHLLTPRLLKGLHPFNENYSCYAGNQWFAANARAAAALLAPEQEKLLKYLTGRFPPDEAFCPTVLGNAVDLKVGNESKHYIRWQAGHHPRLLDESDLPDMLSSNAHFARKFAPDAPVLDALDAHLRVAVA
jgi:Core-2/I-Branching enzyme